MAKTYRPGQFGTTTFSQHNVSFDFLNDHFNDDINNFYTDKNTLFNATYTDKNTRHLNIYTDKSSLQTTTYTDKSTIKNDNIYTDKNTVHNVVYDDYVKNT